MEEVSQLRGNRFLSLTSVIRLNQIEVTRDKFIGGDESQMVSLENARTFRETIRSVFPDSRITWAISYGALTTQLSNFSEVKDYIKECHRNYGDDVTYFLGGYFANAYNTRAGINEELDEAMVLLRQLMGRNYKPKSIIAGFLSSENQKYLAEKHDIHVCQGTIWSQYSIDNQDGDGSIVYPYYPSIEHFCKPAQSEKDFVDCVCLDGWSCDFVSARLVGCNWDHNSRMGVGPIETIMSFGAEVGIAEQMETTACHFDKGFELNGFAFVPNNWELCLLASHDRDCTGLREWLTRIKKRWPETQVISKGEVGLLWRKAHKNNDQVNYRFQQQGTGIAGSFRWLKIKWFMNKGFRLAVLKNLKDDTVRIIDFTEYEPRAREPGDNDQTRQWSLLGKINQKGTRPQDNPMLVRDLSPADLKLLEKYGVKPADLEDFSFQPGLFANRE